MDPSATERSFAQLAQEISEETGTPISMDKMVAGFVAIANETMSRPIRALTEARGLATSKHVLASFGGAGGQHACEIAEILGIRRVLIHRFSSVLSAYGLAMADRVFELQQPSSAYYRSENFPMLHARLDELGGKVRQELRSQNFDDDQIQLEYNLHMRFDGSDTSMMIAAPADGSMDFENEFRQAYKQEFGFLLETPIVVDDIKVKGVGKSLTQELPTMYDEAARLKHRFVDTSVESAKVSGYQEVYVSPPGDSDGQRVNTPIVELGQLEAGDVVAGPALVIDATQTIFVNA